MSKSQNSPIPLKYRPLTFNELIGQELVSQTIVNAIKMDRVANAYLLTGVRGVGKTTTARIIAKMLNCSSKNRDELNFTPCSECENCIAITESRSVDVYEMDAASRTGISDIRELIEGVQYAPVSSKYKVYIIDEVHMLSTSAFNGLLKTLEEPPQHVKFIFATTEVRKIPTTILSRCQRYDLKRVEPEEMIIFLKKISENEKINYDTGSLKIIARAADGSVRDALSLLDQSIAFTDGNLSETKIKDMIGINNSEEIYDLLNLIMVGDTNKSIAKINSFYDQGVDPSMIIRDLIVATHQIALIKINAEEGVKSSLTEKEFSEIKSLAEIIEMPTITMLWQMLNKGLREISSAFSPISSIEMLVIRIAYLNSMENPDKILNEISNELKMVEKDITKDISAEDIEIDTKVKEIIDFFPGTKIETIDN